MIKYEIFTLDIPFYYIILITIIGVWCVKTFISDAFRCYKNEGLFLGIWRLYNIGIAVYMILMLYGIRRI